MEIITVLPIIFVVLLLTVQAMTYFLNALNRSFVLKHLDSVPDTFREMVTDDEYKKSINYTLDKIKFSRVEICFQTILNAFLVLGGFSILFYYVAGLFNFPVDSQNTLVGWSLIWREGFILLVVTTLISLVSMPFDFYEVFTIETKHGFNKMSKGLWVMDKIKSILLTFIIGLPIVWGLVFFYHSSPNYWWIWVQIAFIALQLLIFIVYPKLILPLFNKLSPLPEGELKDRLNALAKKAGFVAEKIEVIDGSKRSAHSNAYFTGFGKWRRIILYDTLIEQLTPEEIEAVLAHEIGHSKLGHITKRLLFIAILGFAFFGALAWLLKCNVFFEAFQFRYVEALMLVPGFLLFSEILPLFTFWTSPIGNYFSRKHEYEADYFAKKIIGSELPLISALRKLHKKNLGNLTPHPLYSKFYYSHPTLLEREDALKK